MRSSAAPTPPALASDRVASFTSRDGTRIACAVSGDGPPLLLVHGTSADRTRWAPVLAGLGARFTVYAMDRRGRGDSGDGPVYALEREVEDVAALLAALGPEASLLGHSFGGLCAVEAALLVPVRRLVIYEAPMPTGGALYDPELVSRLEALLARDARTELLRTFFREVVKVSPAELAQLESLPSWPARLRAAGTLARELRTLEGYVAQPLRLSAITSPALLLHGSESAPFFRESTELLARALPGGRLAVLAGQMHTAMNTAPALFLEHVLGFLA